MEPNNHITTAYHQFVLYLLRLLHAYSNIKGCELQSGLKEISHLKGATEYLSIHIPVQGVSRAGQFTMNTISNGATSEVMIED